MRPALHVRLVGLVKWLEIVDLLKLVARRCLGNRLTLAEASEMWHDYAMQTFNCPACGTEIRPPAPQNRGETRLVRCPKVECGKRYRVLFDVVKDDRDGSPKLVDWTVTGLSAVS